MRQDLSHVLSIAPGGFREPNKNRWSPHPAMLLGDPEIVQALDDSPRRLPMRPRRREPRRMGFRFSTLKRVLQAQVGRPWDKVFGELIEALSGNVARNAREHITWYVETNCVIDERNTPWRHFGGSLFPVRGLYVHPTTGILSRTLDEPRRSHGESCLRECCAIENPLGKSMNRLWAEANYRPIDKSRFARRENGIWYIYQVAVHKPSDVYATRWSDFLAQAEVTTYADRPDVDRRYVARRTQASRKLLRRLGVRNAPVTI
ncbi:MAG: hypothetical protein IT406_01390 [Candidatus Yanofskybacteria bacterium]|nr:hypothetical protein [Candidatus Yanofskybacteria bacterium]